MDITQYSRQILKPVIDKFGMNAGSKTLVPVDETASIDEVTELVYEILHQIYLDKTHNYTIRWYEEISMTHNMAYYIAYNANKGLCVFDDENNKHHVLSLLQLNYNKYFALEVGSINLVVKNDLFMPTLLNKFKTTDPDFYAWLLLSGLDESIFEVNR